MVNKTVIKIGVIGPKPCGLGGHDSLGVIRSEVKDEITAIIKKYQNDDTTLLGITGLALGSEQDFADVCIVNKMDYICYLAYDDQESSWKDLPDNIKEHYQQLMSSALQVYSLFDGAYSPKKIQQKKERIIRDSDVIIFIKNKFYSQFNEDFLIKYARDLDKIIYMIQPND